MAYMKDESQSKQNALIKIPCSRRTLYVKGPKDVAKLRKAWFFPAHRHCVVFIRLTVILVRILSPHRTWTI